MILWNDCRVSIKIVESRVMRVNSRSGKCGFMIFKCSLVRDAENEIWRCLCLIETPKYEYSYHPEASHDCSTTHLIQTPTFSIVTHFWMIRVIVINFYSTASLDFMIVLGLFRIFFE